LSTVFGVGVGIGATLSFRGGISSAGIRFFHTAILSGRSGKFTSGSE